MQLTLTILLLLIATISRGQKSDIELDDLKFKGLGIISTKGKIIESLGEPKIVDTNYECGAFTNDNPGGPYYQLVYTDFNYIGSDKEEFFLENVDFDINGKMKIYYQDKVLSGRTTVDDFIKIFGDKVKHSFVRHSDHDTFLLRSTDSTDGVVFTFKNGRLNKFEYWAPC
jgi:hypothetical protein